MNSDSEHSSEATMNGQWISNSEIASQVISKYTGSSSSANKRKSAPIAKDDEEYTRKRARNNVAVKKSREKAKNRIQETQVRVEQLSKENEDLQTKVTLLSKELNVLRTLFTNGGFTLPCELQLMNGASSSSSAAEHSPVGHGAGSPPHLGEDSLRHHMSMPSSSDHEKSAFHSPEDSKIPPLRPMPRVVNVPSKNHKGLPPRSYSPPPERPERDSNCYNFPLKMKEYSKKESIGSAPPLLIQPGPSTITNNSYHSPSHYKSATETQHTSVIRSATELAGNTFSMANSLGKFCIIQDPENNGQVKIVPISS